MLIGRQDEISNLTRMLRGGVVCVVGPPGVGKSALARAALPRDGLRIDCSGAQSSDQLLQRLTSALALPDGPGRGPRLVHALAGARAVLLDDVDDVLAASEDLAKSWLDLVPGLTVITTSRAPLRAAGAELLELAPLAPSDGAALLLRSAGPRAGLDPDDDTLLALSEALDGLPLALTLAGDRLRLLTPAQLLAASAPTTLLGGALGRTIASARTSLPPPAAEALTRLSCFHGAFGLPEALAVLGPDGMDALQELRDDSVLSSEGGRFRLLRAVRERVASSLPSLPDHAAVRSAHAQAVLAA
ncbi:MAG: hypothetical protein KDA24_18160, partial [Deltaproteobacteria bacterium]|nr:hypothetical protein [Deltaproteobacteria bacterium]